MPAIKDWLTTSAKALNDVAITTSRLDSEVILAHCLGQSRTFLHANPELIIDENILTKADEMIKSRINRVPIAYLTGYKEFYGRQFRVNEHTLIPRPESEMIIEILKDIVVKNSTEKAQKLVDVGTGSGCLGITAKLELPFLDVTLADISPDALTVASFNATALKTDVTTLRSDLLSEYTDKADIIIANLPYVDKTWQRSPETNHEPALALFADNNGKQLIEKLIIQSTKKLSQNGYLILESDPVQHDDLINFAKEKSFTLTSKQDYIIALKYSN